MELTRTLSEFSIQRKLLKAQEIGFVPTMGNLHAGHLSLIEKSLKFNQVTIISIFVNPKQFSAHEDLDKYPRTLEGDCKQIKELNESHPTKTIIVFAPESSMEIYPENFDTKISVGKITKILCGKSRPAHFDGVATVVHQLFQIVKPKTAYFGLKDYQQFKVISKMVQDLRMPIELEALPIKRNNEGLALSSRNKFLSKEDAQNALFLSKTINEVTAMIKTNGLPAAYDLINKKLNEREWDYLEILQQDNLSPPQHEQEKLIVLGALKVGSTRLIDNTLV